MSLGCLAVTDAVTVQLAGARNQVQQQIDIKELKAAMKEQSELQKKVAASSPVYNASGKPVPSSETVINSLA
jgi:hypothetical protein